MNHNFYKRLLSDYLDGEIGLADKQAFEEALRGDPRLHEEFQMRRRLGLGLSQAVPEVNVHPYRFRQRLADTIDRRQGSFLTPQRAFNGAMAIALVVVSITFGLFIYQQRVVGNGGFIAVDYPQQAAAQSSRQFNATLVVETTPENFYNRLLLETQLGLADPDLTSSVCLQTGALEGASCVSGQGLNSVVFPARLPYRAHLRLSLASIQRLQLVADGLTGRSNALALFSTAGELITQQDYLLKYPAGAEIPVELIFQQY